MNFQTAVATFAAKFLDAINKSKTNECKRNSVVIHDIIGNQMYNREIMVRPLIMIFIHLSDCFQNRSKPSATVGNA